MRASVIIDAVDRTTDPDSHGVRGAAGNRPRADRFGRTRRRARQAGRRSPRACAWPWMRCAQRIRCSKRKWRCARCNALSRRCSNAAALACAGRAKLGRFSFRKYAINQRREFRAARNGLINVASAPSSRATSEVLRPSITGAPEMAMIGMSGHRARASGMNCAPPAPGMFISVDDGVDWLAARNVEAGGGAWRGITSKPASPSPIAIASRTKMSSSIKPMRARVVIRRQCESLPVMTATMTPMTSSVLISFEAMQVIALGDVESDRTSHASSTDAAIAVRDS